MCRGALFFFQHLLTMSKDRFIVLKSYLDAKSTGNIVMFEVVPLDSVKAVDSLILVGNPLRRDRGNGSA